MFVCEKFYIGSRLLKCSGEPTGKFLLGRLRCRYEDCIRLDLKRIGTNTRDLFDSAHVRNFWAVLINAVLILRVP